MDDVRTPNSQEPPDPRNGIKDGSPQSQIQQRRIEHTITATVDNDPDRPEMSQKLRSTRSIAESTRQSKRLMTPPRSSLLTKPASTIAKTCLPKRTTKRYSPIGGSVT